MGNNTEEAFDQFRAEYPLKPCNMDRVANPDELRQMRPSDGLELWIDGPQTATKTSAPIIDVKPNSIQLWVVRSEDVALAAEQSDFGKQLESGRIKHSNLTGGAEAHCGGELVWQGEDTIVLTGASGRYGPSSLAEMDAVAKAFRSSGYGVWSLGFSEETGTAFRFGDRDPDWVE